MNIESTDQKMLIESTIIESITKEVMKRLEEKMNTDNMERCKRKEKILAIAVSDQQVLSEVGHQYMIDCYEDQGEHININVYEYVILGSISHQELVHLSIGLANNTVSSLVIEAILAGKKIFVLKEGATYNTYQDTANTNFYNMLKGYEEQLTAFGIEWIYANEIDRRLQETKLTYVENAETIQKPETSKEVCRTTEYVVHVKTITESLAKEYHKKGCERLLIKKHTIVTPLARDYLRGNKINMITT